LAGLIDKVAAIGAHEGSECTDDLLGRDRRFVDAVANPLQDLLPLKGPIVRSKDLVVGRSGRTFCLRIRASAGERIIDGFVVAKGKRLPTALRAWLALRHRLPPAGLLLLTRLTVTSYCHVLLSRRPPRTRPSPARVHMTNSA